MAFFTTQRKETGSYNDKRTKPCRSRRKGKIYNEKTKNGKLTVWGAYERVILAIQNARNGLTAHAGHMIVFSTITLLRFIMTLSMLR